MLPESQTIVVETCKKIALPPRVTPGDSKNNFLESFKPQLPWPQQREPEVNGGNPTRLPEYQIFNKICKGMTPSGSFNLAPPRELLGALDPIFDIDFAPQVDF